MCAVYLAGATTQESVQLVIVVEFVCVCVVLLALFALLVYVFCLVVWFVFVLVVFIRTTKDPVDFRGFDSSIISI